MRVPPLVVAFAGLAGFVTLCSFSAAAPTGELIGRVALVISSKISSADDAVVWLPGVREPNPHFIPKPTITQREKRFDPHVLAIRKGGVVSFPNLDRIYHNVFSLSPGSKFDLGLYRGGASKDVKFETPGLVRVYCNIHPQMAAYVFVVDGASFAVTDQAGRYRIGGIPAGPHTVRLWHEKGGGKELKVEVIAGETVTLDAKLEAGNASAQEGSHKNKHGEDYPAVSSDADRY